MARELVRGIGRGMPQQRSEEIDIARSTRSRDKLVEGEIPGDRPSFSSVDIPIPHTHVHVYTHGRRDECLVVMRVTW